MSLFHKIRLGDRKGRVVLEKSWRVGHIPHVKLRFCTGFFITVRPASVPRSGNLYLTYLHQRGFSFLRLLD